MKFLKEITLIKGLQLMSGHRNRTAVLQG